MTASYLTQVVIANDGWRNQRRVNVGDLRMTWLINEAGRLSCFVAVKKRDAAEDLKGKLVYAEHPTCGIWAGRIEDDPIDFGAGTVEINAASMAAEFGNRRGPRNATPTRTQAGGLALIAIRSARSDEPLSITDIAVDEIGPDFQIDWRGDTILDLLNRLQSQSGQEWIVYTTEDLVTHFEWRRQVGRDLRGQIMLVEGYQISGGRVDASIGKLENDRLATGNNDYWSLRRSAHVEDKDSIIRYGRRQGSVHVYPGLVRESSLRAAATADLATLAKPAMPTEVRVAAEANLALLNYASQVREGDWVKLWTEGRRETLDFRITGREADISSQIVTFSGYCVEESRS